MGQEPLSAKNPRLKHLRRLVNRGDVRAQDNAVVAEGPVLVAEALASGREVRAVYAEASSLDSVAEIAGDAGMVVQLVADGALASVLGTQSPRPVAAVIESINHTLADLPKTGPVLVLVDVRDPGNAGTLMRTAEASGMGGLILAGTSVDPTNPKVIRASAGAAFRLPVVKAPDAAGLLTQLAVEGRPVAAAVVDSEAVQYTEADLTGAAIVLGNEAHGLTAEIAAMATVPVNIAFGGPTESLNVAATGAVLCFESLRQIRNAK